MGKRHADISAAVAAMGIEAATATGLDRFVVVLERMRLDGAVVMIKLDGERKAPGDAPPYTVLVSHSALRDRLVRADLPVLEDAIMAVVAAYAAQMWTPTVDGERS